MLRPDWGLYTPDNPKSFVGKARSRQICAFNASDISTNVQLCERTKKDIRLDGVDHYYAAFQIAGRSTIIQNDHAATLVMGDVALLDSARPVTYLNDGAEQWLALQLPRQAVVSHLGFEPQGGLRSGPATPARRALYQLILESAQDEHSMSARSDRYTELAVYDLLGALFVPSDRTPTSLYSDRLFNRICDIIRERFADPDFGPCDVAIEAGISMRYLQKLFSQRGSTCNELIYSLRLNHAARLLHRRKLLSIGQPVNEVAYICGFRDYRNFSRRFRQQFGHSPAAHAGDCA